MKRIIFLFFILTGIQSLSQDFIWFEKDNLKSGIYKNIEEYKFNSPSLELVKHTTISKKVNTFSLLGGVESVEYVSLLIDKEQSKKIGKIFGFCDGKNVYILSKESKITNRLLFNIVTYIGKYSYYEDVESSYNNSKVIVSKVLDMNSNEEIILTKPILREIISDNNDLLYEFELEKHKYQVFRDYIIEYCEYEIRIEKQLEEEMESMDD